MTTHCPAVDTFESDFVLSEFLHDLDELDQLPSTELQCINPKRQRDPEVYLEPEPKKIKPTTPQVKTATATKSPRKRRSTSWLRRKQELHALRNESEALETRVTFLQMERERRKAFKQSLPPRTEDVEMWKSIADIARQECQSAQNENARLKNAIQLYARASETLRTQFVAAETRRPQLLNSTEVFTHTLRVGLIQTRRLCFDNNEIFDVLERRINSRFHELDVILSEAHRPTEAATTEQVQVCREDGLNSAATVEFRHVRLLPFGEDAMATSIWEIIELGGVVTKTNTRVVRSSPTMVGTVSRHTVPLGDKASVTTDVHTVIKRVAVSTGMVALIESRSEWSIKYSVSEVAKSTTDEGGWVHVHEYPLEACSPVSGAAQRASQLRTSVKLRPNEDGNASSLTSTIVDVVIPSFRDILSSHHQLVENFLLDSERMVKGY